MLNASKWLSLGSASLKKAQVGAFAAKKEIRCAPLGEIREVPGVRDIWRSQAESPLAAHDKIACSFSRIFDDARCCSARRAVLIDASDRAPLHAAVVFAEHVRHDTRWGTALKDLTVNRLAIGIFGNLQKDRHRRSLDDKPLSAALCRRAV